MDCMVDIETLGKKPGCAVIAIGAVCFDEYSITSSFYAAADLGLELRGSIDPGTLKWWLKQSGDARSELISDDNISQMLMFHNFVEWLPSKCFVWSHGASFDPPVLEACMALWGMEPPWSYKNLRDDRTLIELAKELTTYTPPSDQGTAHNAFDDALNQAHRLIAARRALRALKGGG